MSSVINPSINPVTPEEVVRQLRALRELIPDFVLLPASEVQLLTRAASVDIEFVHAAINAVGASENLRVALGSDAEVLRSETELTARWSQVLDEIDALRSGVIHALRVRRHRVGGKAFQVYQVSRHLARYGENADLLPHIEAMRRAARRFRRRTAPAQPAQPQPEPQPDPKPEVLAAKKS